MYKNNKKKVFTTLYGGTRFIREYFEYLQKDYIVMKMSFTPLSEDASLTCENNIISASGTALDLLIAVTPKAKKYEDPVIIFRLETEGKKATITLRP